MQEASNWDLSSSSSSSSSPSTECSRVVSRVLSFPNVGGLRRLGLAETQPSLSEHGVGHSSYSYPNSNYSSFTLVRPTAGHSYMPNQYAGARPGGAHWHSETVAGGQFRSIRAVTRAPPPRWSSSDDLLLTLHLSEDAQVSSESEYRGMDVTAAVVATDSDSSSSARATPTMSRSPKQVRSKTITVVAAIELLDLIATKLELNTRKIRERNFQDIYKIAKEKQWALDYGLVGSLSNAKGDIAKSSCRFKQKCKLLLQERRSRQTLGLWRQVQNQWDVERIAQELAENAGACPAKEFQDKAGSHFNWDFTVIAQYFYERGRFASKKKNSSPGRIIHWPQAVRDDIFAKIQAVHREESIVRSRPSFIAVYERFDGFFSLAELELACLACCSCDKCKRWECGGKEEIADQYFEDCEEAAWGQHVLDWTKRRALVASELLKTHQALKAQNATRFDRGSRATYKEAFLGLIKSNASLSVIQDWSYDDLLSFLPPQQLKQTIEASFTTVIEKPRKRSFQEVSENDADKFNTKAKAPCVRLL